MFLMNALLMICYALVISIQSARLPRLRYNDPAVVEAILIRDSFFFDGGYPRFLKRQDYDLLEILEKRDPATNTPNTGLSVSKMTQTGEDSKVGTMIAGKQQVAQNLSTVGGVKTAMPSGPVKMPQNSASGKTMAGKDQSIEQWEEATKLGKSGTEQTQAQLKQPTSPTTGTMKKNQASYYSMQNSTVKSQLIKSCDLSTHVENTHQKQLLFIDNRLDGLSDDKVRQTLAQDCFKYQDKVEPQYSYKNCGFFNNNRSMPKCSGEFYGGRVPGQKSVYTASCEIVKVSNPEYFGDVSDNVRNSVGKNANGNNAQFTSKFLDAQGASPYTGFHDFCKNVPVPSQPFNIDNGG